MVQPKQHVMLSARVGMVCCMVLRMHHDSWKAVVLWLSEAAEALHAEVSHTAIKSAHKVFGGMAGFACWSCISFCQ